MADPLACPVHVTSAAGSGTSFVQSSALEASRTKEFCSRHARGRQVTYKSQFQTIYDRGHAGKAEVKARLIGDLDPEWELPPKPKWMRWRTYNRLAERFEIYDDMTYPDDSTLIAKLMRRDR